jgi:hypothetical protein
LKKEDNGKKQNLTISGYGNEEIMNKKMGETGWNDNT